MTGTNEPTETYRAQLDSPIGDGGEERHIDRIVSEAPGPEMQGVGAAIGRDLDEALAALPERQRSAVLLRHQQGMRYREIGVALQIPEGTAKTLVHRGVRALRAQLKDWDPS